MSIVEHLLIDDCIGIGIMLRLILKILILGIANLIIYSFCCHVADYFVIGSNSYTDWGVYLGLHPFYFVASRAH